MATVAGTINLTGCNYQLQYDIVSQSIENNTTTIRLYGVLNVSNNYVSWSSGSASVHTLSRGIGTYYAKGSHTLVQGDFTFTHDSNGDLTIAPGYSITTTFVSGSSSALIQLPHINRASQPSCITYPQTTQDVGNIGDTITIYMNRKNNNYYHTVRCGWYAKEFPIATNVADSCDWTIPEIFAKDIPNTNKSWGTIFVDTYYNGTLIGTRSVRFDCHVANANPIFNDFDFEDVNTITKNLTGSTLNNVINVNGYSNIQATITTNDKAEPQKYASMVKYRLAIGDSSTDISYSDEEDVSGVVNGASNGTYNLYAIDSRNNSTLITKQATNVINYDKIYLDKQNCSITRDNGGVGDNATLTINGTFWNDDFGAVNNSIKSVQYRLKKSDSSTWITGTTTITPTTSNNTFSFTGYIASDSQDTKWNLNYSYNVEITISDELSSSTVELILNSAVPTLSLDKEGVGVMCSYDSSLGGLLQVGGKVIDGGKILWTNSNPNAAFSSQTITLSSDDYDVFDIFYYANIEDVVDQKKLLCQRIIKGYSGLLPVMYYYSGKAYIAVRQINYSTNTSYSFGNSYFLMDGSNIGVSSWNTNAIPVIIIGYKNGLI